MSTHNPSRYRRTDFYLPSVPERGIHFVDGVLFWDTVADEVTELAFSVLVITDTSTRNFSVRFSGRPGDIIDIEVRDRFGIDVRSTPDWHAAYHAVLESLEAALADVTNDGIDWSPAKRPEFTSQCIKSAFRYLYDADSLLESLETQS